MWKICDVQPFLLLSAVLDLRLLFRKPFFVVGPYLLSLLDAGIALQGLITQVYKCMGVLQNQSLTNSHIPQPPGVVFPAQEDGS